MHVASRGEPAGSGVSQPGRPRPARRPNPSGRTTPGRASWGRAASGRVRLAVVLSCLLPLLAGCSTPAAHYYSLRAAEAASSPARPAAPAGSASAFAISVLPVTVPESVDRPQIVVQSAAIPGQVVPLNEYQWVGTLRDELRGALSASLTSRLGVVDIGAGARPQGLPLWQVEFRVERFDSRYDQEAVLGATWRLSSSGLRRDEVVVCHGEVRQAAGLGIGALVAAHGEALERLAAQIARQLAGGPAAAAAEDGVALRACHRAPAASAA